MLERRAYTRHLGMQPVDVGVVPLCGNLTSENVVPKEGWHRNPKTNNLYIFSITNNREIKSCTNKEKY